MLPPEISGVVPLPSDPLLALAFWTGIGAIVIALLMLAAVFALRVRLVFRQRREQRFIACWRPLFIQCIDSVPEQLPPVATADRYIFLRLWNHYHESLRGQASHNLNLLAAATGMDAVARDMILERSVRLRLIAVTSLGHLRDKTRWHELRLLVDDPSPLLSLAAMRALLKIDAATTLTWLAALIGKREDWPLAKVAAILEEIGPDRITLPLISAAETAAAQNATAELIRLLRLLEVAHAERVVPAVRRILQGASDERVIAACLRLMNDPRDIGLARRYTAHPSWIVRLGATRALGRIGMPEDRKLLVDMLGDPSWWVRYHAARALVALPFVRIDELQKIRAVLPDRFAADMLGQVIAEKQST
ncbi:MAG: HEAT repeat domain-containing protein [Burkholderiales bacterium]